MDEKFVSVALTAFLFFGLSLSGCVERRLTIQTRPSGALITLNDEEVGYSPVTTSFNWYGDYNVVIRKDGFETLKTHRKLKAPLYDSFPLDFMVQCLYPGTVRDTYRWSFDLQPRGEVNNKLLIDEAQKLRQQLK